MKNPFVKIDYPLIGLALFLAIFGLTTVYSATYSGTEETSAYFVKQLVFSIIGFIFMIGLIFIPMRMLQRFAFPFYLLSVFLLIFVLFFGAKGYGAERWLAIGSIRIQPSEFAKLATILAVANYLSSSDKNINKIKDFLVVSFMILLPFVLIIRQPDLGTSLVFLAITVPIFFWAGLHWFYIFVILSPAVTLIVSFHLYAFLGWILLLSFVLYLSRQKIPILVAIFILHITIGSITPSLWNQLKPYQQKRILTFANPESDPKGAGYQIIQSKVAIGSGGIYGKGYLNGTQTQLKFLPAQHTDFIFSVIGEERGLSGVLLVLVCFTALLLYLLHLAVQMRSAFASISTVGIATVLFFHIIVNIGMAIGLAPVTGLPLPFISYGGSFLFSTLIMIGFVLNFSMNRFEQ
ncbi:MAG: rod shape-determining protein RodA [Calditrichaceae bacterium]|nr:rod shape-determining protein RodA [Calditrichaceae bacterium]RQV96659.1 MAG: rod shape-determining protein RodA [Calditrichota bacterium]